MDYKQLKNDLINILKFTELETIGFINAIKEIDNYEDIDKLLEEANKHMKGFGVESLTYENTHINNYYYDIIALYINMGDTYDNTLIYDTTKDEFLVLSWGDFLENYENERGDDD